MNIPVFSSLLSRLALLVLLAVLPAVGLVIYTSFEEKRLAAREAEEEALRFVQIASSNQARLIEGTRQLLVSLARLPEVRKNDARACSRLFKSILTEYPLYANLERPLYANLGAIKPNGDLFCSALPFTGRVRLADRSYFRRAFEARNFAIGDYQIGRVTKRATVNFGFPVIEEGQIRAVVFAALELDWLSQVVTAAKLPEGSTLTMIDRNGTVLVRYPEGEKWLGKSAYGLPIVDQILTFRTGTAQTSGFDGVPRLYGFTPLFGTPEGGDIYVAVGIPQETVLAGIEKALRRNLAGLGSLALLIGVIAWVGGNFFILRPVNSLMSMTDRLTGGDLSARIDLSFGSGELNQLARSFDKMASSLQQERAKLEERERTLSTLMSNLPGMAYRCRNEPQWRMDFVSDGCLDLTGYRSAELTQNKVVSYADLIHPEDRERVWDGVQAALEARKPFQLVYRIRTARGEEKWVWEQGCGVFPKEGGLLAIEGFITDVTAERKAQEAARKNLERIQGLHEIDLAISSTLDLHHVLDVLLEKVILFVPDASASAIRLLNKDTGALEPVRCRSLDEKDWLREKTGAPGGLAGQVLETKGPIVVRNVLKDPRVRDPGFFQRNGLISYLGVPLISKKESLGVLSLYTQEEHEFGEDEIEFLLTLGGQASIAIENARIYEALKKQAAELEIADKVKTEFLSVISHELRTPLTAAMGYVQMMEDGFLGEINSEQAKGLQKVTKQCNDLLSLINATLDVTRLQAGAAIVEKGEVDLREFLSRLRILYDLPLDKDLHIEWNYPADLPVIQTDEEKLKRIIENLINNAVKFTEKGTVKVSVEPDGQNGRIKFKVADTGIGIARESVPIIFDLFRQVDSSETRIYGGMGVGLYIVKRFTEMLGGEVDLESKPGKGSTFTVSLPAQNGPSSPTT